MKDIIHTLPDSVANQIAAGEVIQRPASLIKELVENSIDAGATHVSVVVVDAGKTLVQVVDNGKGMSPTDARLAFERHATSKISVATDLFSLHTMGFRGEALASIAAVAQVELLTRRPDDALGTRILIEGSHVKEQAAVTCPVGSNFAVRNLFFNIPARRKFLKSDQTELSQILSEFQRMALAHTDVAFTLFSDDEQLLDLPAQTFYQRISGIFGRRVAESLIPLDVDTPLVAIRGFIGVPSSARRRQYHQYLFTQGRFMRHPYFARAITAPYDRLLQEGTQPPYFLTFSLDPERIDVNIHPQKTEIKFEDEGAIFQILQAAVREALAKSGVMPTIDFDAASLPEIPAYNPALRPTAPPQVDFDPAYNPFRQGRTAGSDRYPQEVSIETGFNPSSPALGAQNAPQSAASAGLFEDEPPVAFFAYGGRYILTPTEQGLRLIDVNRASFRIHFDRYLHTLQATSVDGSGIPVPAVRQRLLFPEEVQFTPAEDVILRALLPHLRRAGFDIEHIPVVAEAEGSFVAVEITAIPAALEGGSAGEMLTEILADVRDGVIEMPEERIHQHLALTLARRAAAAERTARPQALTQDAMTNLQQMLFATSDPAHTPDGKPTFILLPEEEIARRFS